MGVSTTQSIHSLSRHPFLQWVHDAAEVSIAETPCQNQGERVFQVRLKNPAVPPAPSLWSDEEYSIDYLLKNADLLEQSNDYFLARTVHSFILAKKDSRNIRALYGLGVCHFKTGDFESAQKRFLQLAEVSAEPEVYFWLGRCLLEQGKELLAMETLRKVTEPRRLKKGMDFEYFKLLGNCLTRTGRMADAESAFRVCLEIHPNSDVVRVNLGMLELRRKNSLTARQSFQDALRYNPKSVKAITGLGLVAVSEGASVTAVSFFNQALDLDPKSSTAMLQLFALGNESGLPDLIVARAERLLELDPENHEVRYYLAAWYLERRRWTECEKQLIQVVTKKPGHTRAQTLLSEIRTNLQKRRGVL